MRRVWKGRGLSAAVAAAALATTAAASEPMSQPRVLAAWSQIFGATEAAGGFIAPRVEMRFVLEAGAACDAFDIEYRSTAEGPWRAAAPAASRSGAAPALAVEVCAAPMAAEGRDWREARLLWAAAEARLTSEQPLGDTEETVGQSFAPGAADGAAVRLWGGASIGTRRSDGTLVAASLGDTGCRGVPSGAGKPNPTPADAARLARMSQPCDPASWPLAELAEAAAARAPDLVIHVGDYRYFLEDQVPQPANRWLYWQKDFFPAAQPLLLAAPIVAARGNHESCGQWGFGDGYFQLFGPGAVAGCAGAPDPLPPEAFDVAPGGPAAGGADAHRFVVLDTNDDAAEGLEERYRTAMALTRAEAAPANAWWVTHVPAIMLIDYDGAEHTGDTALQADLAAAAAGAPLTEWFCGGGACRPSQVLMGHQHLFQTVEFPQGGAPGGAWTLPRQVMVGHGGTKIDPSSPAPEGATACRSGAFAALAPAGSGPTAVVETVERHGLAIWTRNASTLAMPAGWALEAVWAGEGAGADIAGAAGAEIPDCRR